MIKKSLIVFILVFISLLTISDKTEAGSCTPVFPATTCDVSDSVTVTATVPSSTATFTGVAPASSIVTIKDNSVVSGTATTDPSGNFVKTIVSTAGLHDFVLSLTDTSGRTTPDTTFSGVNLPNQIDTPINNILLPPTIDVSKSSIIKGDSIAILGQGSPLSTIHIILNGSEVYSGVIGGGSDYNYTFNSGYIVDSNNVSAFLTLAGYADSVNSFTSTFTVGNCRRSDLNCDGHVNLTDFSILMYWWKTAGPTGDINHDGTVGLVDFSIMLYDWTD